MTVYSYSRVSTGRQAREGESLDAQERRCEGYAMMLGAEVAVHFIERGVSGSVPFAQREQAGNLLRILKRGDKVVCCKLDRCFRSAVDALEQLEWFKTKGIELHLIDMGGNVCGNGIAKLVFTILSAVAEAERDRIRERISDVKAHQREQGRYLGGTVPFGYRRGDDGQLVEHEQEQYAIREMVDMRADDLSLRQISARLKIIGFNLGHRAVADVLARASSSAALASVSHTSSSGSGVSSPCTP